MKQIKIVVEDSKKGKIEFPITIKEARDIYDFGFMIEPKSEFFKTLKLNKIDKTLSKLFFIFSKVTDAIDDGRCYKMITDKKGEDKLVLDKKTKFYHSGRKPKWNK